MTRRTLLAAALTLLPLSLSAQSPQLKAVLDQLDAASHRFRSAQADVRYDIYTRVVDDHSIQTGSLFIESSGSAEHMGAIYYDLQGNGQPNKSSVKILAYDGGTLQMFSHNSIGDQVDVFKARDNQARYESFLTLGFGGSGTDLSKAWNITDKGPETIDGVKTEHLDLVSKDPDVLHLFRQVSIWVDPARGLSLRQVFYSVNGDTRTALYTNIKLNAPINKKPYTINPKAPRVNH